MAMTDLYALIERRPGHPNFGRPFYIGIGTKKRPRRHLREARSAEGHRNWRLQEVLAAHFMLGLEPAIEILETLPDRAAACDAERGAIASYGRMDLDEGGILCNLARGGEGPDADLMRLPEIRQRNSEAQKRRPPESRAASDAALARNRADPVIEARRRANSRAPQKQSWEDPVIRAKRTLLMLGRKKTMSPAAIAQRQVNGRAPASDAARAAQLAASLRNWADPAFRQRRSVNQTAAWADPTKRANMLAGRSDGIAESWDDPEVRAKREAAISAGVADKWRNDPDYAERARAGLRAAWQDPEKKAERVAKMLETRRRRAAERGGAAVTDAGRTAHSEVMQAVNAGKSAEGRSAEQRASWTDPETRERRLAGIRAAAQDPELRAARVAAMLEGKRCKAAERAAAAAAGKGECA